MASAIREFGFRIPIVAKSDGSVVDGHLRLKAARKLGLTEVPVALADELTDAQIKAFRLLANRPSPPPRIVATGGLLFECACLLDKSTGAMMGLLRLNPTVISPFQRPFPGDNLATCCAVDG